MLDSVAVFVLSAEQVGTLGHEVDSAEDEVFCVALRGDFGELVAVTGDVGEAQDFVALVVVAEQQNLGAKFNARGCNSFIHGVIGQGEIILETARLLSDLREFFY